MNCSRLLSLAGWLCLAAASLGAAGEAVSPSPRGRGQGEGRTAGVPPAYPLWDGKETVAQYARRVNLPETQTLDLGNGVTLELVLIPAGRFIVGTPIPQPVEKAAFLRKIIIGQVALAAGGGILLVLIGFSILRAIREKRRFQYSLRRFMGMAFAASLCVLGGMHWWYSAKALAQAQAEHKAALASYRSSYGLEKPGHEVTLTKAFYMAKLETTQEQYQQETGTNPSRFNGPKLPVQCVPWDDAQEFCKKVGEKTGQTVRLPTEAEWEFACRAGTTTTYYSGNTEADLGRAAWYDANSKGTAHPVGQKEPNAWGLYDMHGSVWEWCADRSGENRGGAASRTARVWRGGSLYDDPRWCRSATRLEFPPGNWLGFVGFRVVLAGPP